jgi:hypothetical protein
VLWLSNTYRFWIFKLLYVKENCMDRTIRDIYLEYGVDIRDKNGSLRNVIDVLEDIYFRVHKDEYKKIEQDIYFQTKVEDVFQKEKEKGL